MVVAIDSILPQTQCTKCGFQGCLPYAKAVAAKQALHNRCVPGGKDVIKKLSNLLGKDELPLDPKCGVEQNPVMAIIREDECIGCTKCIQACPVDAIVGSAKKMHTVIQDECSGCDLCVEPCPVDCIDLVELTREKSQPELAKQYRDRYYKRDARLKKLQAEKFNKHATAKRVYENTQNKDDIKQSRKAYIASVLRESRIKKS
ncbi:MAG: hypothetical protein COB50_03040 [Thiotrichales bacterium]|nr:MAG: hypothetical protein COB50_03040 [Thiotrichales bacterium]